VGCGYRVWVQGVGMNDKNNNMIKRHIITGFFLFSAWAAVFAQARMIDRIVAVVGDNTVLQSDIESMYLQYRAQGISSSGNLKCEILEEYLGQMLLLHQAQIDSIEISESQVEMQLDARLEYFINQVGSQERLEDYFNKTILEIKEDFRDLIRDQLITNQMQSNIVYEVTITPSEVRQFYNRLPDDSIPNIDSKIKMRQIVLYPPVTDESKLEVRERLLNLRKRILQGENFRTLAVLYSEDPSAAKGGELGFAGRAELDPAYTKVAFSLKEGQVSNIVESAFGFHIIQLIERREDKVNTRHILMKPKVDPNGVEKTILRLDSIANAIRKDSITFERAAFYYSQDKNTNVNGGRVVNPYDNSTEFVLNELQPEEFEAIRDLKVNEISDPFKSTDENRKDVYKIIMLTHRTEPHRATLKDDYLVIQKIALMDKQDKIFKEWIDEKIRSTYIHIDESFTGCQFSNKAWKQ
jgi:peptidyl-prolyl cis-trans isomerase SurA